MAAPPTSPFKKVGCSPASHVPEPTPTQREPPGKLCIATVAVGRRHCPPVAVPPGTDAKLRHEENNPRDSKALQVCQLSQGLCLRSKSRSVDLADSQLRHLIGTKPLCQWLCQVISSDDKESVLGYVPRALAAHLQPLLSNDLVAANVSVLEGQSAPAAPLPIRLTVSGSGSGPFCMPWLFCMP